MAIMLAALWACFASTLNAIEFPNSHEMATGGTIQLSGSGPSTVVNAPGLRIENYEAGLELGYVRRYDLSDLDHLFVTGAGRYKKFSGGIGLAQFGKSELYTEKMVKGSLSFGMKAVSFGVSATVFQVEFGRNYGSWSASTFGAGVGYTGNRLRALLTADNLTRPKLFAGAVPYPLTGSWHLEWKTARNLSTMVRATKEENESVSYGLGQRIPLSNTSALYWGVSTRPVEYGGGLDIGTKWFTFTYSARIHPVLGFSQNVSIGFMRSAKKNNTSDLPEQDFE